MRINQQIKIITESVTALSLRTTAKGSTKVYNGIDLIQSTLKRLSLLPHFQDKIGNVNKYLPEDYVGETITLGQQEAAQFESFINQLKAEMNNVNKVLQAISNEPDENSLFILLPDYPDYHAFIKDVSEYGKIFDQALSGLKDATSIKFGGVDLGTSWLILTFGSLSALNIVAGLIWSGCVIRKKKLEGDALAEQVNIMKLKKESVQDLVNKQKELLDSYIRAEAEYLIKKNDIKADNEYPQRLMYSIDKISEMINRGTEFHPSLSAPEESSNLFPDYSKLDSITTHIKQIKDKSTAQGQ